MDIYIEIETLITYAVLHNLVKKRGSHTRYQCGIREHWL